MDSKVKHLLYLKKFREKYLYQHMEEPTQILPFDRGLGPNLLMFQSFTCLKEEKG